MSTYEAYEPKTTAHSTSRQQAHPAPTPEPDIRHGDALEVLRSLPDESIHAVVTDPPYAIDRNGAMLGQVNENYHARETHGRGYEDHDPALFLTWCQQWATECLRVLKPGGHLIAFGGTRTYHQLATATEAAGLEIRDQIIWAHGTGTFRGRNLRTPDGERSGMVSTLTPAHEPAVLARKPLEDTLDRTFALRGTGSLNGRATRFGTGAKTRALGNLMIDEALADHLDPARARLFFIAKPDKTERVIVDGVKHPTVKPLNLMRQLVTLVTPPGGTVLDPFAGSGTTVEAAVKTGRRCVAIEREAKYLPLIEARIARNRSS